MKEEVNVKELIGVFRDMAVDESLLARGPVTQKELLRQIEETIVKVAEHEVEDGQTQKENPVDNMEDCYVIKGKFYLKTGAIIEESIPVKNEKEEVVEFIKEFYKIGSEVFKGNVSQITFGNTVFNGSELAAVSFRCKEVEE